MRFFKDRTNGFFNNHAHQSPLEQFFANLKESGPAIAWKHLINTIREDTTLLKQLKIEILTQHTIDSFNGTAQATATEIKQIAAKTIANKTSAELRSLSTREIEILEKHANSLSTALLPPAQQSSLSPKPPGG